MNPHQHTILALFIIIIFLRVYQAGKIQSFWGALNGIKVASPVATPVATPVTKPPSRVS